MCQMNGREMIQLWTQMWASKKMLPGYKMSNNDLQHIENPWYPNMHELSYHKHFLERGTPCPLLKLWFIVSSTFTFLQGVHIDPQADGAGKKI